MSLIKNIENNIFAVGNYWGNLNSFISSYDGIYSMSTGIAVADLNWTWNQRPLTEKDYETIKKIKSSYQELNLPFWWWVYPSGKSEATRKILQNQGFYFLESIPCLIVDLTKIWAAIKKSGDIDIAIVQNKEQLIIWEEISFTGFEMPEETKKQYDKFVASFDLNEESPQKLFFASSEGKPVATALLFFQSNTAGIYFVTTLPAYRNKGIARALILGLVQYAKTAGYKYCILQSSKEGLNVYLQAGFKEYCKADVYSLTD